VKLKKDSRNSSTINILVILQKCVCLNSKNKNSSTLHEKAGISPPEIISTNAVVQIQKLRKVQPSSQELIDGILKGSISSLSRAITLIESSNTNHLAKANEVINACLPHANKSIRIGITGVPGVGKSTFIEAFGKHLTGLGKKVAVLAIDPSSTISQWKYFGR
jgi:LAO/AO transport system kinase